MQNELEKFVFSVSIWYTLFVYNNLKIWKSYFTIIDLYNSISFCIFGSVENIFAVDNILGVPDQDLMAWNVNQDTLPYVVVTLIEILLEFAGTIAIFSLIYHAVKMQLSSGITGDASWVDKAKRNDCFSDRIYHCNIVMVYCYSGSRPPFIN